MLYPFEKTTVGSVGILPEQPGYGEDEFFYMLSQYLHGEAFAVAVAERLLADDALPATLRQDVERLYADECRHVSAIEGYLARQGRVPFPAATKIEASVSKSLKHAHPYLPLLVLNVVVESFGIGSINLILRYGQDEEIKDILRSISEDEARHVSIAPRIEDWRGLCPTDAATWLLATCAAMRESTCSQELVARYWGEEAASLIYEQALKSPLVKRQALNVFAVLMRTLKQMPVVSAALPEPSQLMTMTFAPVEVC